MSNTTARYFVAVGEERQIQAYLYGESTIVGLGHFGPRHGCLVKVEGTERDVQRSAQYQRDRLGSGLIAATEVFGHAG